jgi:hypothetical protein
MIDLRFVPLDGWPTERIPSGKRRDAPFGVSYTKMLDDLERELRHLGARDVVIQAGYLREDIRNDGWPRSSAPKPTDPGVIISFLSKSGQEISFPCDTYRDYWGNLRAISLTLTALRAIDRYGVTRHDEQYKGWAKLPAAPDTMSTESALEFFGVYANTKPVNAETLKTAYREAARILHPDKGESSSVRHAGASTSRAQRCVRLVGHTRTFEGADSGTNPGYFPGSSSASRMERHASINVAANSAEVSSVST